MCTEFPAHHWPILPYTNCLSYKTSHPRKVTSIGHAHEGHWGSAIIHQRPTKLSPASLRRPCSRALHVIQNDATDSERSARDCVKLVPLPWGGTSAFPPSPSVYQSTELNASFHHQEALMETINRTPLGSTEWWYFLLNLFLSLFLLPPPLFYFFFFISFSLSLSVSFLFTLK